MTTETDELKHRIAEMDGEGLRKIIDNQSDYRQVTIDLATEELGGRNIHVDSLAPSTSLPIEGQPEDKTGTLKFLIFRLVIPAVLLFFAAHAIFAEEGDLGNWLSAGLMIVIALCLIVGQKGLVYVERFLNSLGFGGSNDPPEDLWKHAS